MSSETPHISIKITMKAVSGKEEELSDLLSGAAKLVAATEPATLFWYATRIGTDTFTINDGFKDQSGVDAHFNGQVAAALKAKAGELVVGGWEHGVLPNVEQAAILSSI
ncbi:putative quinol monooxygenase [Roseibium sp. RKSG952]|uniref:putative quinol monooxygenase n=1 Tax=Roseibium sp. RKSG952 TaxID=2529384 RepID=UPI0012BC6E69|nr:hypothetical protein [Roseibium sp. RKSG952]MTH96154.1 hypothetical protein [Roseibium sp. RKSG952]